MRCIPTVLIAFLLLLQLILPITVSSTVPLAFPSVYPTSHLTKMGNVANVYQYYSKEPAPMGVADFGVNQTVNGLTAYIIKTTQWEGKIFLNFSFSCI